MSTQIPELSVGQRIQHYRMRRGLSQAVLGGLVGRTEDWVSKVENDHIIIDKFSMLIELARVLRIRDLSDLTGRAIVALGSDEVPEHESVPAIRRALHRQPSRMASDLPGDPLSAEELAGQVSDAWRVYEHETQRYALVGSLIPNLLAEAHHTLRNGSGSEEDRTIATRSLVQVYHLMQVFLRRVGERTLSQIAADRAMALSDQSGDPMLISASAWNVASILTNSGDVEESADLARDTIDAYPLGDDASNEHVSVHGALHLAAAIALVRSGDAPAAWNLLSRADEVARRLPGDRNDWRTSFGPCNVAMHGVHLAAEEGDASEALRLADTVEVSEGLPLERHTRYLIEVMNAHRLKRDPMGTLWMAQKIRTVSPEEMKYHPLVRASVGELLKREKPSYRQEVRDLARHVGVLAE